MVDVGGRAVVTPRAIGVLIVGNVHDEDDGCGGVGQANGKPGYERQLFPQTRSSPNWEILKQEYTWRYNSDAERSGTVAQDVINKKLDG